MISKNMKKLLSSIITAIYLIIYAAPIGMCISNVPQIDAGIKKPVLRGAYQPSSIKLEGDVSLSKKNPKISLSLRNSDVKQVLRMLADKAGLNIIFHSSVDTIGSSNTQNTTNKTTEGTSTTTSSTSTSTLLNMSVGPKITLDLVNVPLNNAFKMITQVSGLTYFLDNNTIIVASADAAKTLNIAKQEMLTIPVNYARVESIAEFLNKNVFSKNKPGLSNGEIAVVNPISKELIIFGTKNDYLMAKKIVKQLDIKPLEKTFKVNYTTPKEMANLICQSIGKGQGPVNGASSNSSDLTLGEGVLACQFDAEFTAGDLVSFKGEDLSVFFFPQRGTIMIQGGSEQEMDYYSEFIKKNDVKQPQAYLEVSIVELSESGMREFDNTWRMYSEFFSGSFDGSLKTNPNYQTFFKGNQYEAVPAVYTLVYNQVTGEHQMMQTTPATIVQKFAGVPTLAYSINYLIQNGKGRVLANPRIMITNGQTSTIDLSSDYVKTVTSQIVTTTSSLTPTVQRTYTIGNDEGIKVDLMPFISLDGYVTLNIKPVYSTVKEKVYAPSPDGTSNDLQATLLQRRNLDLKNVRIKDGETLAIGGMIREAETKSISKLPGLGDLPGVGMFFRNTSTTKEKQELVIMITPKVIKDTEDVVSNPSTAL